MHSNDLGRLAIASERIRLVGYNKLLRWFQWPKSDRKLIYRLLDNVKQMHAGFDPYIMNIIAKMRLRADDTQLFWSSTFPNPDTRMITR